MFARLLCIGIAVIALAGCRFEKFTSSEPLFSGADMPISADAAGYLAQIGDHPDTESGPKAESKKEADTSAPPKYTDEEASARLHKFFGEQLGLHFPTPCTLKATLTYFVYFSEVRGMQIFNLEMTPDPLEWAEKGDDVLPTAPPVNAVERAAMQEEINKFGTIPDEVCYPSGDNLIRYTGQGHFKISPSNIFDLFADESANVTFHKIGGNRLTGERYVAQAKLKNLYGYEFFERSVLGTFYIYTAKEGAPSELTKDREFKSREDLLAFAEDVYNERGFTKDDIRLTEIDATLLRKFDTVMTCQETAVMKLSDGVDSTNPEPNWSCF